MKRVFRSVRCIAAAALLATGMVGVAHADAVIVVVDARSGPWDWVTGGLNDAYQYGLNDHLPPALVNLSSLGIGPGDHISITAFTGPSDLTNAFGGPPEVDNNGYVVSVFKDDALGSTGTPLPSLYMPGDWGSANCADATLCGVFLQALVGAILDASYNVLQPLSIGTVDSEGTSFVFGIGFDLPSNAAFLALGFNDDLFDDNTGSIGVCVHTVPGSDGSTPERCQALMTTQTVPAPSVLALMALGLSGLLVAGSLRRGRSH